MFRIKTFALVLVTASLALIAACAPGAAVQPAPTADTAMMAKETDSAMMMKATDTAMMAKTPDAMMAKTPEAMMVEFPQEKFSAHFVDSLPMHAATLDKAPAQIVLNFNFTLSDASKITVQKDGKEIKSGAGKLGDKRLSMSTELPADAGAGLYQINYTACWPDGSCHDGLFAFAVK